MERLHELHYVTNKKTGIKYSYSITDDGIEALKTKHVATVKDKEAGSSAKPAFTPSEVDLNEGVLKAVGRVVPAAIRPANTDIQCQACKTWNVFSADFCKECGKPTKARANCCAAQQRLSGTRPSFCSGKD